MGIHTGEPFATDEGYVGTDVHRAARIAAAGHGGQILVSQSTRDLIGSESLTDLGLHRLKDLTAPEHLYQVGRATFSPLKSLNQTNLPVQPTPLVGRDRETAEVGELLRLASLVTLTGPGGCGKTRLALQAAAEAAEEFADGVWFVSLAALRDSALIEPTIVQTLGLGEDLEDALRGRKLLLVLDNIEQMLPEAAGVVAGLDARVLATSRERLNVAGEHEYSVPNLQVDEGVALFSQRARQLDRNFQPDEYVSEIVRRLDGLPLALELAAARVKVLTAEQIEERLGSGLELLRGGSLDAPERQRTLHAAIQWSFELLTDDENRLFTRLAVFAGSFELDAAETICDIEIDDLQSLVDKSLLRHTAGGRFFMLETIREFAEGQFARGVDFEEINGRHASYFAAKAEKLERDRGGPETAKIIAWFRGADANIRAALDWLAGRGDDDRALRLATAAAPFWAIGAGRREGLERLGRLLENAAAASPSTRAAAFFWAADLAERLGELARATLLLEQAREIYELLGDHVGLSRCLSDLGWLALDASEFDSAIAYGEEARKLGSEVGDLKLVGRATRTIGNALANRGDHVAAIGPLEEATAAFRQVDDQVNVAASLISLAHACAFAGQISRAEAMLDEALTISERLEHIQYAASAHAVRAEIAILEDRVGDAGVALHEAIKIAMEAESPLFLVWCVRYVAAVAARHGEAGSAVRLFGAAESMATKIGASATPDEQRVTKAGLSSCREALPAEEMARHLREGQLLGFDRAVSEALQVLARIGEADPLDSVSGDGDVRDAQEPA
jgi:predicted ATPase